MTINGQKLAVQLSSCVSTFALTEKSPPEYFEEANALVLRGFSRHAAEGKTIDPVLKGLKRPSENYCVIVSCRDDKSATNGGKEIFSVMTMSKGTKDESNSAGGCPPVGHIVFSRNRHGETEYLYRTLGVAPYEVAEVGNFVCIDSDNHSVLGTPDGFEAFFNGLRLSAIWALDVGVKFYTAVMKPSLNRLVQRTIGVHYVPTDLQPNLDAPLPGGLRVSQFVENIPGYISLGNSDQPSLYYTPAPDYFGYMNSRCAIERARRVSVMLSQNVH